MTKRQSLFILAASTAGLVATLAQAAVMPPPGGQPPPPPPPGGGTQTQTPTAQTFADPTGQSATVSAVGPVAATHPFFASLGTNGRACVTCHQPSTGWSIIPSQLQTRFAATNGLDPVFRTVDGSNAPNADVSTVTARRNAYSMLLTYGDIRVGLPVPANAEFTLVQANDPYHFATSAELSLFRRPLPATNLGFLSTVMWDGRESPAGNGITADLRTQAIDAIVKHEQAATAPSAAAISAIVAFETGLYSAQTIDNQAGALDANGATGGPLNLSKQSFSLGINDPAGAAFNPHVFSIYDRWAGNTPNATPTVQRQQAIARGQAIFNNRTFAVSNVGGLNNVLQRPVVNLTCSGCHNSPNAGGHSTQRFFDLGLSDANRQTPDLPLYTLQNKTTKAQRRTTDPGRALVTGKWADIGEFKVPTLRDLPARAPFFHNGSAASTADVINFYNRRFGIGLNPRDQSDLKAFLDSL